MILDSLLKCISSLQILLHLINNSRGTLFLLPWMSRVEMYVLFVVSGFVV